MPRIAGKSPHARDQAQAQTQAGSRSGHQVRKQRIQPRASSSCHQEAPTTHPFTPPILASYLDAPLPIASPPISAMSPLSHAPLVALTCQKTAGCAWCFLLGLYFSPRLSLSPVAPRNDIQQALSSCSSPAWLLLDAFQWDNLNWDASNRSHGTTSLTTVNRQQHKLRERGLWKNKQPPPHPHPTLLSISFPEEQDSCHPCLTKFELPLLLTFS